MQPVAHRRPNHHQQLAGRRRHLRARLEPLTWRFPTTAYSQQCRNHLGRNHDRSGRIPGADHHRRRGLRGYQQSCRVPVPRGTAGRHAAALLLQTNTNVHNNSITSNASLGDELFSATPAGGGRRDLLHRFRLLPLQQQLGVRQPEHRRRRRRRSPGFSYNGDISHNASSSTRASTRRFPPTAAESW